MWAMHKKIAVIKTSADGQKPVSTFASLHFQVFSGFIDR